MRHDDPPGATSAEALFDRLHAIVMDGLQHGYFKGFIAIETVQGRKRRVTIEAGKSYQYTLQEEEIRRSA